MTQSPELRQHAHHVASRLLQRFPHIPQPVIDDIVGDLFAQMGDAPVKLFVPILVERRAHDILHRDHTQARALAQSTNL